MARLPVARGLAITAAFFAIIAIAGCTSVHPKAAAETPTSIPIDFGTPRPKPTATNTAPRAKRHWFWQTELPVPSTREGAILAATKAIDADQKISVEMLEQKIPWDSLGDFETGNWLTTMSNFFNDWGDDDNQPIVDGHPPVWISDPAESWVTPLLAGGESYQFGRVEMLGCFKWSDTFLNQSDGKAYDASLRLHHYEPYSVGVQYSPSQQVWLVADETYLTADTGAPKCPPAGR